MTRLSLFAPSLSRSEFSPSAASFRGSSLLRFMVLSVVALCGAFSLTVASTAQTAVAQTGPQVFPATNVGVIASNIVINFGITSGGNVKGVIPSAGLNSSDFFVYTDFCNNGPQGTGDTCYVSVIFKPSAPGLRLGALNLVNSSTNAVLATVLVSGTGLGPLAGITPGVISTVAGNGTAGYVASQDTGTTVATSAEIYSPYGVAVDGAGNLYIADRNNSRIRKVTAATGYISTVAGNGTGSFAGDGGAATSAEIYRPNGVAVDGAGNLYIADTGNYRIRMVTAAGIISTVAGTGQSGSSGDGAAATAAKLSAPASVAVDGSGNLYIADTGNNRVRMITASTGYISTIAGNGTAGFAGDGGAATSAEISSPYAVAVDGSGDVYIADYGNNRIREVSASSGNISTVAGNGTAGYSGDGGAATSAHLYGPVGVAVDGAGNFYISDINNDRVRKVTSATGTISTVAGNGTDGFTGDGAAATSAELYNLNCVAVDGAGNLYIADRDTNRIRKVTASAAPLVFASERVNSTTDAAQVVTLTNNGTQSLTLTTPSSGSNPSISGPYTLSSSTGSCSAISSLVAGATCTETITFAPVVISTTNTGSVITTDNSNNPNVTSTQQIVSFSGTSTGTVTTTALAISPISNVTAGQTVTLTATITPTAATGNNVQFYNNGTAIGGANAYASGTSTYQDANIAGGTHNFTAIFTGTGAYEQSTSSAVVLNVPPTLTSLSTAVGLSTGGNTVVINGAAFTGATAVTFGTTAATSFTFVSDTQITAVAPAGTIGATVDVRVTTGSGTTPVVAADQYFYQAATTLTLSIPDAHTGDSAFQIAANSNSNGPVVYTLISGPATLNGTTVSLNSGAAGRVVIEADQAAYGNYTAASVQTSFTVEDGSGSVWIVNGDGTVSEYDLNGNLLSAPSGSSGAAVGTVPSPQGAAFDSSGDLWLVGANGVNFYTPNGTAGSSTPVTGGGISNPQSVIVDGTGHVWVLNGNGSVSLLTGTGSPITPSTGYTGGGITSPSALTIDTSGNLWITNGNNSLTEILGGAGPIAPLAIGVQNGTTGARP